MRKHRYLKIPRFVKVLGNSMYPTYKEEEVLFVRPIRFSKIKEGDVIVFLQPGTRFRLNIKRVDAKLTTSNMVWVLGDNADKSHDSRDYGWVHAKDILGIVRPQRKKVIDNE